MKLVILPVNQKKSPLIQTILSPDGRLFYTIILPVVYSTSVSRIT